MQNYEPFCVFILQYKNNDINSEGDLRKDIRRGQEILYLVIKKYVSF